MEARDLSAAPGRWPLRLPGAPVLLYHAVGGGAAARYTLSRTELARHLEQMRAAGCQLVGLADFRAGASAWPFPVVLTFDDGHASDYTDAFALLAERGLMAEFFLNPATVGRPGFITWDQAREMARAGMSIQSHALDHVYLTRQPAAALARQLAGSRSRLEDELGRRVEFVAVPYGDVNRRVVDEAVAAGYQAVCTSWPWPARAHRRTIGRVCVYPGTTAEGLARLLAGHPLPYVAQAARAAALYPAKRALLRWKPSWRRPQREGIA